MPKNTIRNLVFHYLMVVISKDVVDSVVGSSKFLKKNDPEKGSAIFPVIKPLFCCIF
jgi:hypothetical protein